MATVVEVSASKIFGFAPQGNANAYLGGEVPTHVAPPQPNLENIHAFSYLGTELGVSQRTANETHAAVTRVDALLK